MVSHFHCFEKSPGRDAPAAPVLVAVSPGVFLMGGIAEDKFVSSVELPQHVVSFSDIYLLGKTPVTRAEWIAVMGKLPANNPPGLAPDCPVVGVSFPDVHSYLEKLTEVTGLPYRLPSEAEWENACRAGSTSVFPHGKNLERNDANFLYDERGMTIGPGSLTPVTHHPANAYGFRDLLGNVCEWTADEWHPDYRGAPADGSAWTYGGKSGLRTIRGGGWDHLPRVLRPSWRDWAPENACWDNLGFRVACDL